MKIKIKLDSGKEIELTEQEYAELMRATQPVHIPPVILPLSQPQYPWYPGCPTVTYKGTNGS